LAQAIHANVVNVARWFATMQLLLACIVATGATFLARREVLEAEVFTTSAPEYNEDHEDDDSMLDEHLNTPEGKQLSLVAKHLDGSVSKTDLFSEANKAASTMQWKDAVQKIQHDLPEEIVTMLQEGSAGKPSFDEASLDKARETLNGMIETAQEEYDLKYMECRAFKERNRGEFTQTVGDLSRLGSNVADDNALILDSKKDISSALEMMAAQKKLRRANTRECMQTRMTNAAQLRIIKADLKVARFIVHMTKCKEGDDFLQTNGTSPEVELCPLHDGNTTIKFKDPMLAHQASQIMSEQGKLALRTALFNAHPNLNPEQQEDMAQDIEDGEADLAVLSMQSRVAHRLIQEPEEGAEEGAVAEEPPSLSDIMNPTEAPKVTPPKTSRSKAKMGQKCVLGKADCGLLNDNMALMWGDIKDAKDELKSIMSDNQAHCKEVRNMHNTEISTYKAAGDQKNVELSEATGSLNTNTEEQSESIESKKMLSEEYRKVWGDCKEILHEILFTNICGTKTVRGEISKFSTEYGPTDILDCEVSDWIGEECSIECIDQVLCDGADPGKPLPHPSCAGGVQNMTRLVVQNKTLGSECPALILEKGCNNIPCAIDCVQTPWSAFSKCSKECGGGAQSRSRNTETRPDNGGEACEDNAETQQCNVESCDRDCVLTDWQPWGPCSRACSTGTQERVQKEIRPKRAFGECAHPESAERFESQTCNEFECPPEPICIAQQDVILAVDVSGSLRKSGFETVTNFVKDLTSLYSLGENFTNFGILEFSNEGKIVQPLTEDNAELDAGVGKINFQRGITNMAQGFSLAKTILMEGRKTASSVVIMLTDAKPSFRFTTERAAKDLRKAGVRVVMVPIFKYGDTKFMKKLATDPPEDNVITVEGGLETLAATSMEQAKRIMTATCAQIEMPEPVAVEGEVSLSDIFKSHKETPHHVRRIVERDDDMDDDDDDDLENNDE